MNFKEGDLIETKSGNYYIVKSKTDNFFWGRRVTFNGLIDTMNSFVLISNIKNTCNELKTKYGISMKANHPQTSLFQ